MKIEIYIEGKKGDLIKMMKKGKIILKACVDENEQGNIKANDNTLVKRIEDCFRELEEYEENISEIVGIIKSKRKLKTKIDIGAILKMHVIRKILDINKWKITLIICNDDTLKEIFNIKDKTTTIYNMLYRMETEFITDEVNDEVEKIIKSLNSIEASVVDIRCPYCDSYNIIRSGTKKRKKNEIKVYECVSCGKKFTIGNCNDLDPNIKEKVINLWIEENKPFGVIAKMVGEDAERVESVVDEFLQENLKDMPDKYKKILLRRLVFRYNNLSMNEIVKTLDSKYGCKILLRTVVNWLRERAIIKKYWDIIESMAKNGNTVKDISYWLEKNEGILIDPVFLEDDLKRMGVEK